MTAVLTAPSAPAATDAAAAPAAPLGRVLAFELRKQVATWRVRLLLLACWTVPAAVVAALARSGSPPSDTLFGRELPASGWAAPLVVLGAGATWLLPVLVSTVAGDVFTAEDRLGTWGHLLVTTRSPRKVFAAKALAALAVLVLATVGLLASSTVGGLLASGNQPLVGLDGAVLPPATAAARILLAWAAALAPTLALGAVGLLGGVALGRSPAGPLVPALLALLLQVAQLLPLPLALRVSLPGWGWLAWRGLLASPVQAAPALLGSVIALVWTAAATGLALALLLRRDLTASAADGPGARALARTVAPLAALLAVTAGTVALVLQTARAGSGVTATGLQQALATSFGHLYRLQGAELGRPDVTEQHLATTAACHRTGGQSDGPGRDWRCAVTWRVPGAVATGTATYQVEVGADGRWVADGDGPQAVNGSFPVPRPHGSGPNPLWQFDGSLDLLARRPLDPQPPTP